MFSLKKPWEFFEETHESKQGRFLGLTLLKVSVPGHFLAPRSDGPSHIVTALSPLPVHPAVSSHSLEMPFPLWGESTPQPYDCPCQWCLLPQSGHSSVLVSHADPMGSCSLCHDRILKDPSPLVAQPPCHSTGFQGGWDSGLGIHGYSHCSKHYKLIKAFSSLNGIAREGFLV